MTDGDGGASGSVAGFERIGYGFAAAPPRPEFAGFGVRFAASLVDALVRGVPAATVGFALVRVYEVAGGPGLPAPHATLLNVAWLAAGVVYYAVLDGLAPGQTWGARIYGLRVVDDQTFEPGVGVARGFGRHVGRLLSAAPLALGYLWLAWDPKKQTWHDKLARTCVVRA